MYFPLHLRSALSCYTNFLYSAQASPAYRDDFDATYDDYYDEDYEDEVIFSFPNINISDFK